MTESPAPPETRCRRCAFAPPAGQLRLFAPGKEGDGPADPVHDGGVIIEDRGFPWPEVLTSACGRSGFWRERTPAVFGNRIGVGPLLIMPDTNILIEIREQLAEVEGGVVIHPSWDAHEDPMGALREVVQLWWFRDLRFAVGERHLEDSRRRPLTGDRMRSRQAAVLELRTDFLERGGVETILSDELDIEDEPCALHAIPPLHLRCNPSGRPAWGWPKDRLDRRLVEAAYDAGCHVFLTADKKVLRCHGSLFPRGLAVMSPGQLLNALDDAGELDGTRGGHFLLPDLSSLSRLYAGFSD